MSFINSSLSCLGPVSTVAKLLLQLHSFMKLQRTFLSFSFFPLGNIVYYTVHRNGSTVLLEQVGWESWDTPSHHEPDSGDSVQ